MRRAIAVVVAVLFASVALGVPAVMAQAPKDTPAKADKAGAKGDTKGAPKKPPLDINTASTEELQTLPGIGDAHAKKIVENRPYKRKDEIVKKASVPQATYDKIKDQIIAKQAADAKTADKAKKK
jgi:DNA uptake protein ComE-like DNA-binding protein